MNGNPNLKKETAEVFVKKLGSFSIGSAISFFIGFISTPIITWLVVPEEFGKVSMYNVALQLSNLLVMLGMNQALMRNYHSSSDKENLFWNTFLVSFSSSLLFGLLVYIFRSDISYLLFDSDESKTLILLALSLPLFVIIRYNEQILKIEEKPKAYSLVLIFRRSVSLLLTVTILLLFTRSFEGIVYAMVCSVLLTSVFSSLLTKWFFTFRIRIDKELIIQNLRYALPLIPVAMLMWIYNAIDKVALKTWSDFSEIGIYTGAFKIVIALQMFKQAFIAYWNPTAFRWYEKGVSYEKIMSVSHYLLSVLMVAFATIVLFRHQIIKLLAPAYSEAARIIPFLIYFPIMDTLTKTTAKGIRFTRKTNYDLLGISVGAVLNIAGNFVLVPLMGAIGAAISTGGSYIVYFLIRTLISRRVWYKFKVERYFIGILLMLSMSVLSVSLDNFFIDLALFFGIILFNMYYLRYLYQLGHKMIVRGLKGS